MSLAYAVCEKCGQLNRFQVATEKKPICGSCKTQLSVEGPIIDVSDRSLATLIKKSPLPLVIDVWAPWCGPCRAFAPTFIEFGKKYAGKIVFAKLNSEEHQQMAAQFGIRGIPTVLLFKDGSEVGRQSGAMPGEMFERWLNEKIGS